MNIFTKGLKILFNNPYRFIKKHNKNFAVGKSVLTKSFLVDLSGSNNFVKIGNGCVLMNRIIFEANSGQVSIGDNTFIGGDTKIISHNNVTIGNNVQISWNVTIYDHDGNSTDLKERRKAVNSYYKNYMNGDIIGEFDWSKVNSSPIIIEDDAWIGFNSIILKGVRIGKGAIIGAGSVLTKDAEEFCVYGGNPARLLKRLPIE